MKSWLLILPLSVYVAGSASAADTLMPMTPEVITTDHDGWHFAFAPYFWAAGLDGDTAQFGLPTASVHESFGTILEDFDIGFMSIAEARRGNFSVFNDLQYSRVSPSVSTPFGVLAESVEARTTTFSSLLGAGYTIARSDAGFLDVAVGARLWSVDTKLSFSGGLLDGTSRSDGDTWVDGLLGFRGNINITPQVYLTGWGLVGAGEADLDWDLAAALGYRFNERFSSVLGYRALGVDYSDGDGFVFDVIQHGPILGLVARF